MVGAAERGRIPAGRARLRSHPLELGALRLLGPPIKGLLTELLDPTPEGDMQGTEEERLGSRRCWSLLDLLGGPGPHITAKAVGERRGKLLEAERRSCRMVARRCLPTSGFD